MSNNTITLRDFLNYCDRPHNLSNFINTHHNEHALPAQTFPVEFLTPTPSAIRWRYESNRRLLSNVSRLF